MMNIVPRMTITYMPSFSQGFQALTGSSADSGGTQAGYATQDLTVQFNRAMMRALQPYGDAAANVLVSMQGALWETLDFLRNVKLNAVSDRPVPPGYTVGPILRQDTGELRDAVMLIYNHDALMGRVRKLRKVEQLGQVGATMRLTATIGVDPDSPAFVYANAHEFGIMDRLPARPFVGPAGDFLRARVNAIGSGANMTGQVRVNAHGGGANTVRAGF